MSQLSNELNTMEPSFPTEPNIPPEFEDEEPEPDTSVLDSYVQAYLKELEEIKRQNEIDKAAEVIKACSADVNSCRLKLGID